MILMESSGSTVIIPILRVQVQQLMLLLAQGERENGKRKKFYNIDHKPQ